MTTCRSCGAPVRWAVTVNGRRMPLDPDPHPTGNCRVIGGEVDVLAGEQLEQARRARTPLHLSHFATCPGAEARRRLAATDTTTGATQETLL